MWRRSRSKRRESARYLPMLKPLFSVLNSGSRTSPSHFVGRAEAEEEAGRERTDTIAIAFHVAPAAVFFSRLFCVLLAKWQKGVLRYRLLEGARICVGDLMPPPPPLPPLPPRAARARFFTRLASCVYLYFVCVFLVCSCVRVLTSALGCDSKKSTGCVRAVISTAAHVLIRVLSPPPRVLQMRLGAGRGGGGVVRRLALFV